jgi:hypothetical protein
MAFEAFVASGAARRDRARRVGVAVSLALHLPPLALFAMQLVVRPVLTERTESVSTTVDASPVVPLRIAGLWAPARPAAAPRVTEAVALAAPAPAEQATRRARRAAPLRPTQPLVAPGQPDAAAPRLRLPAGGESVVVEVDRHPVAPPPQVSAPMPTDIDLERRAAAVGSEMLAGLSASAESVAPALSLSAGPFAAGEAAPRGAPAHELSAGAAAYLRTYETFPTLPDGSWGWSKRTYVFFLKVCVAENGQVDDVIIQRGSRPDLDVYLAAAIRTWRYRPWLVSGSARPFCHPLRITYSRG